MLFAQTRLVKSGAFGHTACIIVRFCPLYFFLCVLSLAGEPLKLSSLKVGSITYTNVTVLGANATDLYFSHSLGFANVKLKYVDTNLQARFQYDPKAAEQAEKAQTENDTLYQSKIAKFSTPQPGKPAPEKSKPSIGSETGLADPISEKSLLGKPAPSLALEKWLGEKPALEGKFILISFWAPWSAPCQQWIPELNALQKKYADKLVVVGVSAESEADVTGMLEPRIDYALALDPKAKLTAAAEVTSIPCILLQDPKGIVLYQGHPGGLTDKRLQAILAKPTE
jgi:thiol-disulfide isomerase/thioredoxin